MAEVPADIALAKNAGSVSLRPVRLKVAWAVTQAGPRFDRYAYRAKNAAFDEWRLSLNPKDKLPRGQFFKGKTPGPVRALLIMDEGWMYGS